MKNGIRESDIIEISKILNIKYATNEFAYLRKILPSYFYQQKDGAWILTNYSIKRCLNNHYHKNTEYVRKLNDAIIKYFISLEDSSLLKLSNIMPLLYEKEEYNEFKRLLLYMIDNNKTYYVEDLLLDIIYRKEDYDLLEYLLIGTSPNKQQQISSYLANLICKYSSIDYDIFVDVLPYEMEDRIDSNSKAIRYFFARINLELCIFKHNEDYLDMLDEEFMDLYLTTKNENIKSSIIDCCFKMIKLSTYKKDTRRIIKSLFKILKNTEANAYYYKNLCKAYIEYMKLDKNNKEAITKYIYEVINIIDKGYTDYNITSEAIDLLFKLYATYYSLEEYNKSNEHIKLIKGLIEKYRYSQRSIEVLDKILIIDYFDLMTKSKLGLLNSNDVNNQREKLEELDRIEIEKELPPVAEFYLKALDIFDLNITKDPYKFFKIINRLASRISSMDEDILMIYVLLYCVVEFISFVNKENISEDKYLDEIYISNNIQYHKKVYKKIIKLINKEEYRNDLLVKKYKKEIVVK